MSVVDDGRRDDGGTLAALRDLLPLVAIVLVLMGCLWLYEPRVLSSSNLYNVFRNAAFLAVIAAGQMLVMVTGGFDLSVGGTAALSSVVGAIVMTMISAVYPDADLLVISGGVLAGLGTGLVVGLANGIAVALFNAPAFMVTLGMLSVVTGAAMYLTAGAPIYGLPELFTRTFARGTLFEVSNLIWICAAVLVAVLALQSYLPFGRHIRAVGGNRHAAHLSGISTSATIIAAYAASGVLAATVGVLLMARLGSGQSTAGLDLMLQSIAVAVVGGVSLRGGYGRIERVAVAALFFAVIGNGMNLVRLDSRYQPIVIGVVIIVATLMERLGRKRDRR